MTHTQDDHKFFLTCFSFRRDKGPSLLVQRLLNQLKENEIEPTDQIKNHLKLIGDLTDTHCMGWYNTYEEAKHVVENNSGDVHECYYSHAVIEKVPWGQFPLAEALDWYQWDNDEEVFLPCDRPDELEKTFGFCY